VETNADRLNGLHPAFKLRVQALIGVLADQQISVRVTFGYRSLEKQRELYKLWRARKGGKANPPGKSWHNYGLAADLVPYEDIDHDGVLDANELNWDTTLWEPFGKAANEIGLIWGKSFGDSPHVEWHPTFSPKIHFWQLSKLRLAYITPTYWGDHSY
jgi:peptidoglycan L-alanyl-D-glutamate endopeptidase CwlK